MDFPQHWSNAEILEYERRAFGARQKIADGRQIEEADVALLSPREMLRAVEGGLCVTLGCPPRRRGRR